MRPLRLTISLVAALFLSPFVASAPLSAQAIANDTPGSGAFAWSVVHTVSGVSPDRSMRSPSLALRDDTLYVAANTFPVRSLLALGRRPAALLRSPGASLPLPPGALLFAHPKGAFDGRGDYHLFWGESEEPSITRRGPLPDITSLWHATLRAGRWSRPERVIAATIVRWGVNQGSAVVDAAGRLHVLVSVTVDRTRLATMYASNAGSRWRVRELQPPAVYATLLAPGGDTLVAAFIATDAQEGGRANSVIVERSADAGAHWSGPSRSLNAADSRLAIAPTLVSAGRTLHLVWAQALHGLLPDVLRHRTSRDGGRSWEATDDVKLLRDGLLGITVAGASCGTVTALVESIASTNGDTRVLVDEIRWTGTGVRRGPLLADNWVTASPAVVSARDDFRAVATVLPRRGEKAITIDARSPACGR